MHRKIDSHDIFPRSKYDMYRCRYTYRRYHISGFKGRLGVIICFSFVLLGTVHGDVRMTFDVPSFVQAVLLSVRDQIKE